MLRSSAAALILATIGLGCSSSDRLFLELPPLGAARSLILVAEEAVRQRAWAYQVESDLVLEPPLELAEGEELTLFAILQEASLDELGLRPGMLVRESSGRSLPLADVEVYESRVSHERASAWNLSSPSAAVTDYRISGDTSCLVYERRREFPSELDYGAIAGLRLDDGKVFIGTRADSASAYVFTGTVAERIPLPIALGVETNGAYRPPQGGLEFAGGSSPPKLFRGDPRGGVSVAADLADFLPIGPVGMTAGPTASEVPYELFIIDDTKLVRFDGQTLDLLYERPGPGEGGRQLSTVVWLGPRRALFSINNESGVHIYDDGKIEDREGLANGITMARAVPGHGTLAVTSAGELFQVDPNDASFQRFTPDPVAAKDEILPLEVGGFLLLGQQGIAQQYVDGRGFCPAKNLATETKSAVVSGQWLYLIRDSDDNAPGFLTVFEMKKP